MESQGGTSDAEHRGRLTVPAPVRADERAYVRARREAAGVAPSAPVLGLALSGGGIRSATTALGALQALAAADALRAVDLLASVSGGGYIAACLSAFGVDLGRAAAPPSGGLGPGDFPLAEPELVHRLRGLGNYLVPRRGAFRLDGLRFAGSVLGGALATLVLALGALAGLAGLVLGVEGLLGAAEAFVPGGRWAGAGAGPAPAAVFGVGAVSAALVAHEHVRRLRAAFRKSPFEASADLRGRRRLRQYAALVLGVPLLAAALAGPWGLATVWTPVLWCAGAALGAWGVALVQHQDAEASERPVRSFAWAALAASAYGALAALAVAALPYLLDAVRGLDLVASKSAALTLVVGGVQWLLARRAATAQGQKLPAPVVAVALGVAGPLLLVGALVTLLLAATRAAAGVQALALPPLQLSVLVAVGLLVSGTVAVVAVGRLVDFNQLSPHVFYRDRLAEVYLVEGEAAAPGQPPRRQAGLRLQDLNPAAAPRAPYHLLVASVALEASRRRSRKDRRSEAFVFASRWSGSGATGWVQTAAWRGGRTTLADAMAVSGAAVASSMGVYTSAVQRLLTTLFNLRLGVWYANPALWADGGSSPTHAGWPDSERRWTNPRRPEPEWTAENTRLRQALEGGERPFWPLVLLREVLGLTHARDALVNLTDGGHTGDNCGVYPLLQRRCDVVVVMDASCDPARSCQELAAGVQAAFIDENVRVDIDPRPLAEVAGRVPVPWVVGRIAYPRDAEAGADPDAPAKVGWLVYVKSSQVRQLPFASGAYAATHPDFPHESTADQFFDDAQFEAYRALGEQHLAELCAAVGPGGPAFGERLRAWCEGEWSRAGGGPA